MFLTRGVKLLGNSPAQEILVLNGYARDVARKQGLIKKLYIKVLIFLLLLREEVVTAMETVRGSVNYSFRVRRDPLKPGYVTEPDG
jgi:hypothetical protein